MPKEENILPSFPIKSLKIENYKGIKSIELDNLPSNANWIFLTGENGYGKTTILQAIAEELDSGDSGIFSNNKFKSKIDLHNKKDILFFRPYLSCYGSSRLNIATESSTQDYFPIKKLFVTKTLLKNIEYQISRWFYKREEYPEFQKKFDSVTTIIKQLLGVSKIEVDKDDNVWYYEEDLNGNEYKALQFKELAAGYRNLLSMIGDMILQLFDSQTEVTDPKDLQGIVIIDELELHLHPKWQKKLPALLSEIFPRIQFIASTHSPIPLLGAPEHSVFIRVDRNAEEGITVTRLEELEKSISNLLPNSILTSPIFGMSEIFPITHNSEEGINTQDFYGAIKVDQLVRDRVDEYMTPDKEKELLDFLKSEEDKDDSQ